MSDKIIDTKKITGSYTLENSVITQIEDLSEQLGVSKSFIVNKAVKSVLSNLQEPQDIFILD